MRGSRSMRCNPFAPSLVATVDAIGMSFYYKVVVVTSRFSCMVYPIDDASSSHHNPQSLVPIPNNPNPLLFAPHTPGDYFYTQSGDISQMPLSAVQTAFMDNEMARMIQEMDSEFNEDNEEQDIFGPEMSIDDLSGNNMSVTLRSQSLSADFNRLTIEELVPSSSRSVVIHGSSSATRADKSLRHKVISGDHTEVDISSYQTGFDSGEEKNNIIINSSGEGKQEDGSQSKVIIHWQGDERSSTKKY